MSAIAFLLKTLATFYGGVVLLRLLMQLTWDRSYNPGTNPVSRFCMTLTNPLILPMRRVLPSIGKVDTASLVLLFLIMLVYVVLLSALVGQPFRPAWIIGATIVQCLSLLLTIYTLTLIVGAILSWFPAARQQSPIVPVIDSINEPLLRPIRRLVPPISGIDLSVMIALVIIIFLDLLLRG